MKLYKLSQSVNNEYDTYDSAIVCAENKEDAISINPNGDICKEKEEPYGVWCGKNDVKVEYIGDAKEGSKRGVICASFNAG